MTSSFRRPRARLKSKRPRSLRDTFIGTNQAENTGPVGEVRRPPRVKKDGQHGPPIVKKADRVDPRVPLDRLVRDKLTLSWNAARNAIETGKVSVDGKVILDPTSRFLPSVEVLFSQNARNPKNQLRPIAKSGDANPIRYVDLHVVVVAKPEGMSTVPFDDRETGTLDEWVRDALHFEDKAAGRSTGVRPTLGIVHRIDKDTSGLVVFTRTWLAKQSLSSQFRTHSTKRHYLALVHGSPRTNQFTVESHLLEDRGDGLRGSVEGIRRRNPKRGNTIPLETGKPAVTHVEVLERMGNATLVSCTLETGKTHQIRIHLSESGFPLVGETVYVRELDREKKIEAPRLMLHAASLGFEHPATGEFMAWDEEPPREFNEILERVRETGGAYGQPPQKARRMRPRR